jgi:hypothetical protein
MREPRGLYIKRGLSPQMEIRSLAVRAENVAPCARIAPKLSIAAADPSAMLKYD